jgi:hypothetical protein
MADQWVRLGMAIVIIIMLISIGLYRFSGHAGAVQPGIAVIAYPRWTGRRSGQASTRRQKPANQNPETKRKSSQERERALDRTVARLNIEHYRRLLATETDESRRQVILRLLAEEEAKVAGNAPRDRKRKAWR